MEHKLEWLTDEEGRLVFSEENVPFLTMKVFITGEQEAEFQLQDIVCAQKMTRSADICEEIISKMMNCIAETFRLLWEKGYEETILVEQKGTKVAEILGSTNVVQRAYSEYMMKCRFEQQKSTNCGLNTLKLTKTEDGYICENKEKTFVCRLMRYGSAPPEGNSFYLYEVEVSQEHRNQGIATACLAELVQVLSKEIPVTLYLQVGSYNEPAVHLYKKMGFEIAEELCYYGAGEECR